MGRYHVRFWRGPESIPKQREVTIRTRRAALLSFRVRRRVDPAKSAGGLAIIISMPAAAVITTPPAKGCNPADMMRHSLGEDLKVAIV